METNTRTPEQDYYEGRWLHEEQVKAQNRACHSGRTVWFCSATGIAGSPAQLAANGKTVGDLFPECFGVVLEQSCNCAFVKWADGSVEWVNTWILTPL